MAYDCDIATKLYDGLLAEGVVSSAYDEIVERNGTISIRQVRGEAPEIRYSSGNLYLVLDDLDKEGLISLNNVASRTLKKIHRLESRQGIDYSGRVPLVKKLTREPDGIVAANTVIDKELGKPIVVIYTRGSRVGEELETHRVVFDRSILVR